MSSVIAEIGLNHGGDLTSVKRLIKQAKDAGCWGVKFQYRDIGSFYHKKDEVGDAIIYDEIKRNFISISNLVALSKLCKKLCINFGISIFRVEDFDHLKPILAHIDFLKIPSAECLNTHLIIQLCKTNKKVFVSTGGHKTEKVIQILSKYKNQIILLHCISNYPSCLGTQDLRVISKYKHKGFPEVGYSSHDSDWEICIVALAQGAKWIERHITLEKDANGLDHSSSSIFAEFVKLVQFSSQYEKVLGTENHEPNQGELINLQNLGTSLYAKKNLMAGATTSLEDYEIKAPRVGISPASFIESYASKPLLKDLNGGAALSINHFLIGQNYVETKIKDFSKLKQLGLPVRLHDYLSLKNKFDLSTYEFHLSFTEVLNSNLLDVVTDIG